MNRLKHKETQPKPQEQQTRRNYRTKTQNKQILPIKMTRKHQRHVLEFVLEWKWMKKMKRTRKLM